MLAGRQLPILDLNSYGYLENELYRLLIYAFYFVYIYIILYLLYNSGWLTSPDRKHTRGFQDRKLPKWRKINQEPIRTQKLDFFSVVQPSKLI